MPNSSEKSFGSDPDQNVVGRESARNTHVSTEFDARSVSIKEDLHRPAVLFRERSLEPGEDPGQILQSFHNAKELFAQMWERYRIRSVAMDSVIMPGEDGQPIIITTVDRIEGENIFDAKSLPAEAKSELENMYLSLTQHYKNAWETNGIYWGDCKSSQFVYGNKYGEEDKHLYVVDVDPTFYKPGEDEFYSLEWCLNSIANDLVENEIKFEAPVRFVRARETLQQVIEEMLEHEPDSKPLLQVKGILQEIS